MLARILRSRGFSDEEDVKQEEGSTEEVTGNELPPGTDASGIGASDKETPAQPLKRLLRGGRHSILRSEPAKKDLSAPSERQPVKQAAPLSAPPLPPQQSQRTEDLNKLAASPSSNREAAKAPGLSGTAKQSSQLTKKKPGTRASARPLEASLAKRCRTVLTFCDEEATPPVKGPSAQKRDRSRLKSNTKVTPGVPAKLSPTAVEQAVNLNPVSEAEELVSASEPSAAGGSPSEKGESNAQAGSKGKSLSGLGVGKAGVKKSTSTSKAKPPAKPAVAVKPDPETTLASQVCNFKLPDAINVRLSKAHAAVRCSQSLKPESRLICYGLFL